jgi:hypothetical protein
VHIKLGLGRISFHDRKEVALEASRIMAVQQSDYPPKPLIY